MDTPRRWPWVVGVGLIVGLIIGGAVWFRAPRPCGLAPQVARIESPICPPQANAPATNSLGGASSCEPAVPPVGVAELSPPVAKVPPVTHQTNQTDRTDLAAPLAAEANALLAADKKDKAREKYLAALEAKPDDALRSQIEAKLGPLNVELIRAPWLMMEKQEVIVQDGDSIKVIARKAGTTVELIVKGNELKRPDMIRPGQRLKVFTGKMAITVSKARNDLLLTANGRFFKRYQVGTGRYDKTPVGTFVVTERIPEPPWWREDGKTVPFGDKENILGTRWMAIKATGVTKEIKGYGIHGTWDTNSIGKAESAGCIRLRNEDVEELFELVPVGTPVSIEE